jgi:hypothetical protein
MVRPPHDYERDERLADRRATGARPEQVYPDSACIPEVRMRLRPGFDGDRHGSWQVDVRLVVLAFAVLVGLFVAFEYNHRAGAPASAGSAAERLQPLTTPASHDGIRRTVYVPVYSSVYLGRENRRGLVQLTATLSVRNVSPRHPIVIESVHYYDSHGRPVREHLAKPAELAALASVEFVVEEADTTGGPGANFLVKWSGPAGVDEPLIEAVMLGQSGSAGISFTSVGRTVANGPQ